MARSRKKTPAGPVTNASTDKPYKAQEHRRERRAARRAVRAGDDPHPGRCFGNPWAAPKDGRVWFRIADVRSRPELMRK